MSSSSLNVDQRIVQMQFDNAQFEQGATTTMSTLDKLKRSLDFTGQSNGISALSKSMGNFSAAPMISSLESAKSGFSALQVAAITVISNITSRMQAMGEKVVKAMTIDPVKSGWSEYEQKMDSIKTILNSAKDENGAAVSLDQVKKKIEELNEYADKTIYSFADMTNNIGKFTNAGVDLDTSVKAIQGVANAAAAAGADSNAASRAMYNFAQSLSTGYMQRIDWKSIENANMATVEFKEELLKTAESMGTVEKGSNGMYRALTADTKKAMEESTSAAMFTEKLSTKWLTNDVLIKTLENYSNTETDIGKKAQEAATRVFTLSKMFDTLGEAMQSGWSATWEKIVGDYQQAGDLFTGINNFISGALGKRDQKRIDFLDELLNKAHAVSKEDWMAFADKRNTKQVAAYEEVLKTIAKKHNIDIDSMLEKHKSFTETLQEGWFNKTILNDAEKYISTLESVDQKGNKKQKHSFTKEQIVALKELNGELGMVASSYDSLQAAAGQTGRELILESFKSLFDQVLKTYGVIRSAYDAVFPKRTAEEVYKIVQAFHDWATNFDVSITLLYRFRDALKGVFSIFKIFKDVLKVVWDIIVNIVKRLSKFGEMVLDVAARVGRMADEFRKATEKSGKLRKIVDIVNSSLDKLFDTIEKFVNGGSIDKDSWMNFADTLDPKDVAIYQKVVKRIAREHGIAVDDMIKKNGSFEDSLQEGWFTKNLFNDVNYYLENISKKGTTGKKVYTLDEFNRLKTIRAALDDTTSAYSRMGDVAGKTGAEIITSKIEKITTPLSKVFDVVIDILPTIIKYIGIIGKIIGSFVINKVKLVWKILTIIYKVVSNIVQTSGKKIYNTITRILKRGREIVNTVLKKIKDRLPNIESIVKKIADAVGKLGKAALDVVDAITDFVDYLVKLLDVEGVVGAIVDFFSILAGLTFGAVIFAIETITKFFKFLSSNKTVNFIFKTLANVLTTIFTKLGSGIKLVKTFITELLKLEGVKLTIERVKKFFSDLGGRLFTNASTGTNKIKDFFDNINEKLPTMETVLKKIDDVLKGTTDKFTFIKDTISGFIDLITGAFKPKTELDLSGVKEDAKDGSKSLETSGSSLKTSLETFVKNIEEGMSSLNSTKILHMGAWLGLILIIYEIAKAIKTFTGILKNVQGWTGLSALNPISKLLTNLSNAILSWRKKNQAEIVYTIAKAIGIIALSLVVLAAIPTKKLVPVVADIIMIMLAMSLLVGTLGRIFKRKAEAPGEDLKDAMIDMLSTFKEILAKAVGIAAIGAAILGVTIGITVLMGTIFRLYGLLTQEEFNKDAFITSISIVAAMIIALVGSLGILGKTKFKVPEKMLTAMLSFGIFISMLAGVVKKLSTIKTSELYNGLTGLVIILTALFTSLFALQKIASSSFTITTDLVDLSAVILVMSVAVGIFGHVLKSLSKAPVENIMAAAVALGVLAVSMGVMAHFSKEFSPVNAASIILVAAGIAILTNSLKPLTDGSIDLWQLAKYLGVLGVSLLAFGLIGKFVGGGLSLIAAGLAGMGIAAAGFGVAMYLIVSAIGMVGPALDSMITGLISFSEKLVNNVSTLSAGLSAAIKIVCLALIANSPLIFIALRSIFSKAFSAIGDAAVKGVPKLLGFLKVMLFVLIFGILGFLDQYMPGIVTKVVRLIVRGMNSLAKAITTNSYGIVDAVANVGRAMLILFQEMWMQVFEWINTSDNPMAKAIKGVLELWGVDVSKIADRTEFEKAKEDLLKHIDQSEAINDAAVKNQEAIDNALNPDINTIQDTPNRDQGIITADTNYQTHQEGLITVDYDVQASPESEQNAKEEADTQANNYITDLLDGYKNAAGEYDIAGIAKLLTGDGEISGAFSAEGVNSATGFQEGASAIPDILSTIGGDAQEALKDYMDPETYKQMMQMVSKSAEEGTDFSGVSKKVSDEATKAETEAKKIIENRKKEEQMLYEDRAKQAGKNVHELNYTIKTKTNDKEAKKEAENSGKAIMTSAGSGATKNQKVLKTTVENAFVSAAKGAGSDKVKNQFKTSSGHGVQGALNAFSAKMDLFYKKGVAMASNVNTGYRNTLQVKSPSRVMYKNGIYTIQGLLNAITNNSKSLYKAGAGMGEAATDGTRTALAQMSSLLAGNMDTTPTIRPVLDLTDVANGARSINGMLGGRTLSVNSLTANSLAASMNSRQNRSDMVLSALDNLSRTMSAQSTGNTYNINGITYDDGSNIATAIGMLAHAAIVEGRA